MLRIFLFIPLDFQDNVSKGRKEINDNRSLPLGAGKGTLGLMSGVDFVPFTRKYLSQAPLAENGYQLIIERPKE